MQTVKSLSLLAVFLLTGCAKVWVKPGASTDEFNVDKHACLQQAQQQVSTLAVGKYGGYGQSGQETNWVLYNSCMNSRGWTLSNQENAATQISQRQNDMELDTARFKQMSEDRCSNKKYAAYYAKTPCFIKDVTLEQLADKSKATAVQKPAMSSVHTDVKNSEAQINVALRKYNGSKGAALATYNETVYEAQVDKNFLDLYNGKITWGEFNQQRKANYDAYKKKEKEIFSR